MLFAENQTLPRQIRLPNEHLQDSFVSLQPDRSAIGLSAQLEARDTQQSGVIALKNGTSMLSKLGCFDDPFAKLII